MGYYLEYIVESTEEELLSKVSNHVTIFYNSLNELDKNGLMEGKLKGGKYDFNFSIKNGILNISYPRIKYSWIVNKLFDADKIVIDIDREVINSFPGKTVFRIDELIREDFESQTMDKLLKTEYIEQLNLFLLNEDSDYWKKL
ncbi:hypothetical protein CJ739_516 [Mariniflexile rhizosphaerae]|uniref:hypothetical protein n=1 Tax=unclassified Mariniflexile TaxID=2643887 RepID=UPI000CBFCFEE|nr:hypothetical protein [Mariniflexile sp. TRM1-10]AXP79614.1 hypothetical protein CJ739_516 [Mariniflexile sp. TRM1-10]PLB18550.1 MAG: hypothetical protein TRG1_2535 [Flavobacteriaceae bacterium FS1-H7996/R]